LTDGPTFLLSRHQLHVAESSARGRGNAAGRSDLDLQSSTVLLVTGAFRRLLLDGFERPPLCVACF